MVNSLSTGDYRRWLLLLVLLGSACATQQQLHPLPAGWGVPVGAAWQQQLLPDGDGFRSGSGFRLDGDGRRLLVEDHIVGREESDVELEIQLTVPGELRRLVELDGREYRMRVRYERNSLLPGAGPRKAYCVSVNEGATAIAHLCLDEEAGAFTGTWQGRVTSLPLERRAAQSTRTERDGAVVWQHHAQGERLQWSDGRVMLRGSCVRRGSVEYFHDRCLTLFASAAPSDMLLHDWLLQIFAFDAVAVFLAD